MISCAPGAEIGDNPVPNILLCWSPIFSNAQGSVVLPPRPARTRRLRGSGASLLGLAASAVCSNIEGYSAQELSALPPDLAQLVLDELVATCKLTRASLALFRGQSLWRLDLDDYPDVTDEWLKLVSSSPLQVLSLGRCDAVSYPSMWILPPMPSEIILLN